MYTRYLIYERPGHHLVANNESIQIISKLDRKRMQQVFKVKLNGKHISVSMHLEDH